MQYRAVSRIYIGSPSLSAATARSAHIPAAGSQSTSSVCMNNPGCTDGRGYCSSGWGGSGHRECLADVASRVWRNLNNLIPCSRKCIARSFPGRIAHSFVKKIQQPCGTAVYGLGSSEDQKYLISLPSIAERILFAADDAPMRNRSVVSHSLPRISSTMV